MYACEQESWIWERGEIMNLGWKDFEFSFKGYADLGSRREEEARPPTKKQRKGWRSHHHASCFQIFSRAGRAVNDNKGHIQLQGFYVTMEVIAEPMEDNIVSRRLGSRSDGFFCKWGWFFSFFPLNCLFFSLVLGLWIGSSSSSCVCSDLTLETEKP
jgi:hypothetical protein